MAELKGNKYGTHRVIEPKGVLTQAAWKVDNDMSKVYSNEIVCDVTSLNIDSASFTQISEACGGARYISATLMPALSRLLLMLR